MVEYIGHNPLSDRHVVITWYGEWYKIPFSVLEDIADFWFQASLKTKKSPFRNEVYGDHTALLQWLKDWEWTWKQEAITQIKKILQVEMSAMIAYKVYDLEQETAAASESIKSEAIADRWLSEQYPEQMKKANQ